MTLYIKHTCPWCIEAIDWMRHRKMPFDTVDVRKDLEGYERMKQISGQSLTPTLELGEGSVLADFDVGQLEKFLKDHPFN